MRRFRFQLRTLLFVTAIVGGGLAWWFRPHLKDHNGTQIVVTESALTFVPRTCARGEAYFNWGLGSVHVNVLGREVGFCVFDYTREVEGGWSTYRCRVPIHEPQVKAFDDQTSFPVRDADRIRTGSLHQPDSSPVLGPQFRWQSQGVADTPFVNFYADVIAGAGAAAKDGSHVSIQYRIYADSDFVTRYVGVPDRHALQFTLGKTQVGAGLEAAVQGMKKGGRRFAVVHEEAARHVARQLGGVQAGTMLALEIELMTSVD